jgi:uncharacterized SAM-binding protein YcdF (DUF218 family)
MKTYDLIAVLGSQPDLTRWEFPDQVYRCLERAKKLLDEEASVYIATSGKWSTSIDTLGLKQPFRECDALADALINMGVSESIILKEGHSQDTISNLYYLKTGLLIPRKMNKLLFVVADFRIPRLKFLCERILGSDYEVEFDAIKSEPSLSYDEPHTFKVQKEFLEPMKTGDHEWLRGKFYTAPMYLRMAEKDRKKYTSHIL